MCYRCIYGFKYQLLLFMLLLPNYFEMISICVRLQRACFQLAIASDYRTLRSYVLFDYNSLDWQTTRSSLQGYQFGDGSMPPFIIQSSLASGAFQLANQTGNRGDSIFVFLLFLTFECLDQFGRKLG